MLVGLRVRAWRLPDAGAPAGGIEDLPGRRRGRTGPGTALGPDPTALLGDKAYSSRADPGAAARPAGSRRSSPNRPTRSVTANAVAGPGAGHPHWTRSPTRAATSSSAGSTPSSSGGPWPPATTSSPPNYCAGVLLRAVVLWLKRIRRHALGRPFSWPFTSTTSRRRRDREKQNRTCRSRHERKFRFSWWSLI